MSKDYVGIEKIMIPAAFCLESLNWAVVVVMDHSVSQHEGVWHGMVWAFGEIKSLLLFFVSMYLSFSVAVS